jgi:hypothetical protein
MKTMHARKAVKRWEKRIRRINSEIRREMLLGEEIHRRLERKYDGNVKEN